MLTSLPVAQLVLFTWPGKISLLSPLSTERSDRIGDWKPSSVFLFFFHVRNLDGDAVTNWKHHVWARGTARFKPRKRHAWRKWPPEPNAMLLAKEAADQARPDSCQEWLPSFLLYIQHSDHFWNRKLRDLSMYLSIFRPFTLVYVITFHLDYSTKVFWLLITT